MPHLASIRSKVQGLLLVFTVVILGISGHVNAFQGFFYAADRFPFIMSLFTLVIVGAVVIADAKSGGKSILSRPVVELVWLGLLLVFWLGANAFSTSRWQFIQMDDCKNIPVDKNPDFLNQAKTWCYEIQALRTFIWLEWIIILISFVSLLVFAIGHSKRGAKHVWTTSISRFDPLSSTKQRGVSVAASSFYPDDGRDSKFDFAPQIEGQQQQQGGSDRYSWPRNEQTQRWRQQEDHFQAQPQPERQVQPHYQTQAAQNWEQFDGDQHQHQEHTVQYGHTDQAPDLYYNRR